jgi:general secretion pathway protein B
MSFILDALRKSEIERQRRSGPTVAEFPIAREDRRLPVALVAIGFLLAANVAVLAYFMLRETPAPAATQAAAAAQASESSPPPAPLPASAPVSQSPLEAAVPAPEQFADQPEEMYGEPATLPPGAPDPTLLPTAPAPHPGVTYSAEPPADAASAEAATGLPELTVDLHIYANDPAKRAVFINGRRYVQGAQIAEGPIVEEITREGAVLSYRGRRFLLPRL